MRNNTVTVTAIPGDGFGESEEITLVFTKNRFGRGSFGVVREARLIERDVLVAVKTSNITRTGETKEVECLKQLNHCNITRMLYHFQKNNQCETMEYIVMERMPQNLWDLYNTGSKISEFETKLYIYQLLRGLAYMHAKDICHRDVKPENVLIDPRTGIIKICDFGRADNLSLPRNFPRLGTRCYRAPEMLLGFTNYTKIVDIWSAGCILVELLKGGTRLFSTATSSREQLVDVMEYFGSPTEDQFAGMKPSYPFEDLPIREAKPWSEIVAPYTISDEVISLCSGLLCYSPSSRLLPHEALAHKFFDVLRSPETTRLANGNPLPPLFNFQPGEFPQGFEHLIPSFIRIEIGELMPSELIANITTTVDKNHRKCHSKSI